MPTEPRVVTPAVLRELPLPAPGDDKDANGRLLVVGGSSRSPGAVRLAGEAALRAGAGKVALATIAPVLSGLAPLFPEAAHLPLPATAEGRIDLTRLDAAARECRRADVTLIGPGLVDPAHARALVAELVPHVSGVVVLDGLASAFLGARPDGLQRLAGRAVLSVNPGELARTAGADPEVVGTDPVATAERVAAQCGVVVVCGGTAKHVVTPAGDAWVVEGGGPGLAASGSGDVHAGILGGLLARGAAPVAATVWAAHVHARCGERLAGTVGPVGYLARELSGEVPAVLDELA
ncbi:NAD(P)H-hydrate dehydratase [Nocardioides sp. R1-1]|uniref:ADP-dependent NAD(P)H-hydrate dehydratase n=1 Tax=Nocardioides sp. R1-1 TaxID=3383502 RepID=UPI0038D0788E